VPIADLLDRLAQLEKGGLQTPGSRLQAAGPKPAPAPSPPTNWESFLQSVEEKSPAAYATLALAKPVAFAKDGVILAFAPGELGLAEMRKAELDELVAAALGGKVPVTLRALDAAVAPAAAPSLDESNRRRADEERERRLSEARQHPSTKATLDVFGGAEIKDIKVDFD